MINKTTFFQRLQNISSQVSVCASTTMSKSSGYEPNTKMSTLDTGSDYKNWLLQTKIKFLKKKWAFKDPATAKAVYVKLNEGKHHDQDDIIEIAGLHFLNTNYHKTIGPQLQEWFQTIEIGEVKLLVLLPSSLSTQIVPS